MRGAGVVSQYLVPPPRRWEDELMLVLGGHEKLMRLNSSRLLGRGGRGQGRALQTEPWASIRVWVP